MRRARREKGVLLLACFAVLPLAAILFWRARASLMATMTELSPKANLPVEAVATSPLPWWALGITTLLIIALTLLSPTPRTRAVLTACLLASGLGLLALWVAR